MGGNALRNTETVRLSTPDQQKVYRKVDRGIRDVIKFPDSFNTLIRRVSSYYTKDDHGDLDILISFPPDSNYQYDPVALARHFNPNEIVRNGRVTSFDVDKHQVDLIYVPWEEWEFSVGYFAWNDMGNFIGRTAHKLGFKFGHDGLWYMLRDPECDTRLIKEILITRNFREALEFFDYDYSKHLKGFHTLEEMFGYVTSSRYFDPVQFWLHNRSCEARKRDRTRKSYTLLLEWLKSKYPNLTGEEKTLPVDKGYHLARAFRAFPEFEKDWTQASDEWELDKEFKRKFNGAVITKLFYGEALGGNFNGKELGLVMAKLRKYIEQYNLKPMIIKLSDQGFLDLMKVIHNEVENV